MNGGKYQSTLAKGCQAEAYTQLTLSLLHVCTKVTPPIVPWSPVSSLYTSWWLLLHLTQAKLRLTKYIQ